MSKHDFKAALEDLNEFGQDTDKYDWEDIFNFVAPHRETIQTALRLADRLASGELKEKLQHSIYEPATSEDRAYVSGWNNALEAAQMISEVEDRDYLKIKESSDES